MASDEIDDLLALEFEHQAKVNELDSLIPAKPKPVTETITDPSIRLNPLSVNRGGAAYLDEMGVKGDTPVPAYQEQDTRQIELLGQGVLDPFQGVSQLYKSKTGDQAGADEIARKQQAADALEEKVPGGTTARIAGNLLGFAVPGGALGYLAKIPGLPKWLGGVGKAASVAEPVSKGAYVAGMVGNTLKGAAVGGAQGYASPTSLVGEQAQENARLSNATSGSFIGGGIGIGGEALKLGFEAAGRVGTLGKNVKEGLLSKDVARTMQRSQIAPDGTDFTPETLKALDEGIAFSDSVNDQFKKALGKEVYKPSAAEASQDEALRALQLGVQSKSSPLQIAKERSDKELGKASADLVGTLKNPNVQQSFPDFLQGKLKSEDDIIDAQLEEVKVNLEKVKGEKAGLEKSVDTPTAQINAKPIQEAEKALDTSLRTALATGRKEVDNAYAQIDPKSTFRESNTPTREVIQGQVDSLPEAASKNFLNNPVVKEIYAKNNIAVREMADYIPKISSLETQAYRAAKNGVGDYESYAAYRDLRRHMYDRLNETGEKYAKEYPQLQESIVNARTTYDKYRQNFLDRPKTVDGTDQAFKASPTEVSQFKYDVEDANRPMSTQETAERFIHGKTGSADDFNDYRRSVNAIHGADYADVVTKDYLYSQLGRMPGGATKANVTKLMSEYDRVLYEALGIKAEFDALAKNIPDVSENYKVQMGKLGAQETQIIRQQELVAKQKEVLQKDIARKLLGKTPDVQIANALRNDDVMDNLIAKAASDKSGQATDALRNQFYDYFARKGTDKLKAGSNEGLLKSLFGTESTYGKNFQKLDPEGYKTLKTVNEMIERKNFAAGPGASSPRRSGTPESVANLATASLIQTQKAATVYFVARRFNSAIDDNFAEVMGKVLSDPKATKEFLSMEIKPGKVENVAKFLQKYGALSVAPTVVNAMSSKSEKPMPGKLPTPAENPTAPDFENNLLKELFPEEPAPEEMPKPLAPGSSLNVRDAVTSASKEFGIEPKVLLAMGMQESSLGTLESKGNADGLFQFKPGTWSDAVKAHGTKIGVTEADRGNHSAEARMMAYMAKNEYRNDIKSIMGREPTMAEFGIRHMYNKAGSKKFLEAYRQMKSTGKVIYGKDVFPSAATSNPDIFYEDGKPKTITDMYRWYGKAYGLHRADEGKKYASK